jgi:surfeit locus 1 family protein
VKRRALIILCAVLALAFGSLGVWQLERRAWKLDLIARVDARIHAAPIAPPAAAAGGDEYRRVRVRGVFLNDRETLVQAVTELGPGWWVMTPLRTEQGVFLINRGFVPADRAPGRPVGAVTVTGLLRMSEPHGGFLRTNDPASGRWYSRDVAAIARARGVAVAAPFFIDADATANPGGYPVGGLTVVRFRNAHLTYALTWFALAALSLFGVVTAAWPDRGRRA